MPTSVPARRRLLVSDVRWPHGEPARSQRDAPPLPAARSSRARVPRARPCRHRSGQPRPRRRRRRRVRTSRSATPARCSTPKPSPPTGVASPRSTTTSKKHVHNRDHLREEQADAERDFLIRELSPRRGPQWPRPTSRVGVRARPIRDHTGHPPGDRPDPTAPPRTRTAPPTHHPHRHLLLLPPGHPHARPLGILTTRGISCAGRVRSGRAARRRSARASSGRCRRTPPARPVSSAAPWRCRAGACR